MNVYFLSFLKNASPNSDRDIATKTAARNLSGDTVPHVRHILHTCRTYSLLAGPSLVELTVDPWNAPNADSDNVRTYVILHDVT